jgi:RNA polymerase sigma factor (sigma-70 family)
MRFLKSRADAEDVVQETFYRWLNAEQEKIRNTKAYLIRSVTNNCINHLESLKKKKEEYFDSLHWPEFIERMRGTDFYQIDIEVKLAKALQLIHDKLEPLERAVYILREVFDFDYKALQEVLDKKQDHCRQLLSRAKKKIAEEKASLHAAIQPKKTALFDSFNKACDFGPATDLINHLRQDIGKAVQKNN